MWSKTEKMWSKLTITVYEDNYSLWGLVQRVRVLGSLWKPHQSKELFFPFRYRYPELFPTPPKFGDSSVWSRERGSELRNCGFHFTKHTMFYKGKPVLNQVPYENPVPNHVLDFKQTYLWAQEELVEVLGTYIERKKAVLSIGTVSRVIRALCVLINCNRQFGSHFLCFGSHFSIIL